VLGTFEWQTPLGEPRVVSLFACRPTS
jgi:hypothetical protein